MDTSQTRFVFDRHTCMKEVAGTLLLARLAAESLHGVDRITMEASYRLDKRNRTVSIDAHTDAGHALALIFMGYCRREFGADAVRVDCASGATARPNNPVRGLTT